MGESLRSAEEGLAKIVKLGATKRIFDWHIDKQNNNAIDLRMRICTAPFGRLMAPPSQTSACASGTRTAAAPDCARYGSSGALVLGPDCHGVSRHGGMLRSASPTAEADFLDDYASPASSWPDDYCLPQAGMRPVAPRDWAVTAGWFPSYLVFVYCRPRLAGRARHGSSTA
ncbi:hypothetical protein HPB50_000189 [Hyalomma asiaticum]|uniref:Uncharacterized protein n=1 Tax=Hyalomma asiaticum TaxID=266040 RepID=A0ACB7S3F1_HYAAI|nr:hypothetical protein HPB50_000189 [Hyalomma asiaticum]